MQGLIITEYNIGRSYLKYCLGDTQNLTVDDILCMKPFDYIKEFKNPCWKEEDGHLHCLPYFMLIGMDKCGTTDLFDRLTKHPHILKNSLDKETAWWSWTRYGLWLTRKIKKVTFKSYIDYFNETAEAINSTINSQSHKKLITGDGTPMDMWDFRGWPQIPQNYNKSEPVVLTPHLIHHLNPKMKFIILLRNPVERLYSDYFFLRLGNQTSRGFDLALNYSLGILNNCTSLYSLRKCLYDENLHLLWDYRARVHLGFYSVYLKEWFSVFPKQQFVILRTEDYSQNIEECMSKIFQFLEVDTIDAQEMEFYGILSKERKHKTKMKQRVLPMSNVSKRLLTELYKPFNYELTNLLNDRRFLWEKQ